MENFRQFLESIKPNKKGVMVLVLGIIIMPLIVDVILFSVTDKIKTEGDVTLSQIIVTGCLTTLPWLILYLLIFFCVTFLYNKYFKKS